MLRNNWLALRNSQLLLSQLCFLFRQDYFLYCFACLLNLFMMSSWAANMLRFLLLKVLLYQDKRAFLVSDFPEVLGKLFLPKNSLNPVGKVVLVIINMVSELCIVHDLKSCFHLLNARCCSALRRVEPFIWRYRGGFLVFRYIFFLIFIQTNHLFLCCI